MEFTLGTPGAGMTKEGGISCWMFVVVCVIIRNMEPIVVEKNIVKESNGVVILPVKEYHDLLVRAGALVTESDVLRFSREAKRLHKAGKLPKLDSLAAL